MAWVPRVVYVEKDMRSRAETLALTQNQSPAEVAQRDGRRVEIRDVNSLRFSDTCTDPARMVRVRELWQQREQTGPQWGNRQKKQNWIWVVAGDLDGYGGAAIPDFDHLHWRIENNAFGELTEHWNLTHCAHHHPVAVVALLWIKIIAFTLFPVFALLHGKRFRLGKVTFEELRKRIDRSLLCGSPIRLFSGETVSGLVQDN